MATCSALWALFFILQLHVLHVKSSDLGLNNCCCMQTESKRRQSEPGRNCTMSFG